jgi:GrpB-like predicted nucleotidyltransferase (UPF0157 family)
LVAGLTDRRKKMTFEEAVKNTKSLRDELNDLRIELHNLSEKAAFMAEKEEDITSITGEVEETEFEINVLENMIFGS